MTPGEILGSSQVFSSLPAGHLETEPRAGFKVLRVLGRILSSRLRETNRRLADAGG